MAYYWIFYAMVAQFHKFAGILIAIDDVHLTVQSKFILVIIGGGSLGDCIDPCFGLLVSFSGDPEVYTKFP